MSCKEVPCVRTAVPGNLPGTATESPTVRRTAKTLHDKALASLRRSVRAFNDLDDDGRVTAVLLHLQHAFEMLLKAGLEQRRIPVLDSATGYSAGMDRCINLAAEHLQLGEEDAGTIRAIDALRDAEQHWFAEIDEGLLYTHVIAAVSLFANLLEQTFDGEEVRDHLPARVLPIATEPPRDVQFFIDRQFDVIRRLLAPNSRKQTEARAHIRTLLAMEAHVDEATDLSERDVKRVIRDVRAGKGRHDVFPRLTSVSTDAHGDALELRVKFVRNDEDAVPVRYVGEDFDGDVTGIRERDLQRRYRWSRSDLNRRLGIGNQKGKALRERAGVDGVDGVDERYMHEFTFGKSRHPRYSDEALKEMERTLEEVDIDEIWEDYKTRPH